LEKGPKLVTNPLKPLGENSQLFPVKLIHGYYTGGWLKNSHLGSLKNYHQFN